jgi:hypothetical protein
MRTLLLALVLPLAPLSTACSKEPTSEAATAKPAPAAKSSSFGAGVTVTEVTSVDKILAEPLAYRGKTVRVEGTVVDVCKMRGCWFEVAGEKPGAKLKFKVTDGEMVFPVDSKGMYAVAQGRVAVRDLTLEQSKEYAAEIARENGKSFDPASVEKPVQIVRLDGTGAVFRDRK